MIVSEDLELTEVKYKCSSCNAEFNAIEPGNSRQMRHSCAGSLEIISQEDAVEKLIQIAEKLNIDITFISSETSYGRQFLLGFNGIAAMLKYKI